MKNILFIMIKKLKTNRIKIKKRLDKQKLMIITKRNQKQIEN